MASYATQIKELGKKYGKVAIGVHLSIYLATLTGAVCYLFATIELYTNSDVYHTRTHAYNFPFES